MHNINDMYHSLDIKLRTFEQHHHYAYDAHLVHVDVDEYWYWCHHTTSYAEIHAHKPTWSTKFHLINTTYATAVIVTTTNPHITQKVHSR